MKQKQIIEIKGVKFEVDLTQAERIQHFAVGMPVKILKKEYSSWQSYPGVIVGFDYFEHRPAINIAYAKLEYNDLDLKFLTFHKDSEDIEIAPMLGSDLIEYRRELIEQKFDKKIEKAEEEVKKLKHDKQFFMDNYGKIFSTLKLEEIDD